MNVVEKDFPTPKSTALWCHYHVSKIVGSKCKTCYKVKDLKSKYGKEMKFKDVFKTIMDAWESIM